ncbi:Yip1 family protein [Pseudomonas sp. DTU_2021_1001937_2_SI_NGA_ILE_001]|uniref:Yip1 family protein n=1 Tax=Pseudomonas sp. DTU_2021_1001937_2_SI_NGA_ILE_001 TaxID=3077589 RepID=UPI0028FC27D1|nr:Yip1 family protein [Pseudomonas sp. DTU_2021_1001937_2_SI_NGA_ILE_001]WNW11909.1 Yip1 family protein [Pseudomonas sp. DTU_2021_1001937_2_SI_NGA_ILE_001]
MNVPLFKLLIHPHEAWQEMHGQEAAAPRQFLGHLVLLALLPAVCLFIGTSQTGWPLSDQERVWLATGSALQLCMLLYLAMLVSVWVVSLLIQWLSGRFGPRPGYNHCIGFVTYAAAPFFIAGIVMLYPNRWLTGLALIVAALWSSWLLLVGAPGFMRTPAGKALPYALLVWVLAIAVTLLTLWLAMNLWQALGPEYVLETLGEVVP